MRDTSAVRQWQADDATIEASAEGYGWRDTPPADLSEREARVVCAGHSASWVDFAAEHPEALKAGRVRTLTLMDWLGY